MIKETSTKPNKKYSCYLLNTFHTHLLTYVHMFTYIYIQIFKRPTAALKYYN